MLILKICRSNKKNANKVPIYSLLTYIKKNFAAEYYKNIFKALSLNRFSIYLHFYYSFLTPGGISFYERGK